MMKATGIVRRVDDLGRLVIPKELRTNMGMKKGEPLEMFVDNNGEVILSKFERECIFCGEMDAESFKGKLVCSECRKDMTKDVE